MFRPLSWIRTKLKSLAVRVHKSSESVSFSLIIFKPLLEFLTKILRYKTTVLKLDMFRQRQLSSPERSSHCKQSHFKN